MKSLGIAVVNYESAIDVRGLMASLAERSSDANLALFVAIVDNSDRPDPLDEAVSLAHQAGMTCKTFHGQGNVGYAGGNNLAAAWLLDQGVDAIWILNPDTRVVSGRLGSALDALGPDTRAIAATSRPETGTPDVAAINRWTGQSSPGETISGLAYPSGHSLLIGRSAWAELDGLGSKYFLFYEEADLAMRARRLGIPTNVAADIAVAHGGGGSTGATYELRRKSRVTYFHASRSCMIFFRKHYPARLPVALAARLFYAARVLRQAGPTASLAVLRGLTAGLFA